LIARAKPAFGAESIEVGDSVAGGREVKRDETVRRAAENDRQEGLSKAHGEEDGVRGHRSK
jgi:hypothetical protein